MKLRAAIAAMAILASGTAYADGPKLPSGGFAAPMALFQCDASGNCQTLDWNTLITGSASYSFAPPSGSAESSSAASYTFSSANQAKARGWYANCPASTNQVVTLTDANGGTAPTTLYDGHYGPVAERIASFSGNAAGCTIGLEF